MNEINDIFGEMVYENGQLFKTRPALWPMVKQLTEAFKPVFDAVGHNMLGHVELAAMPDPKCVAVPVPGQKLQPLGIIVMPLKDVRMMCSFWKSVVDMVADVEGQQPVTVESLFNGLRFRQQIQDLPTGNPE